MQPIPVVIDTDPGLDDAVAILFALASPAFDIRGVTTVAGNIGLARVTENAGRLLAVAGRGDVPVVAGAAAPLVRPARTASEIHGADGLGGVALPAPLAAAREGAVAWLAAALEARPGMVLLTLGPLTNLALLLRDHPGAAGRIGRVIAMGGAVRTHGNVGPRAEFNIAADPEAADAVFAAGLDLTLIPLDVTREVRAGAAWCAGLRASGRAGAVASAALVEAYFASTTVTGPGAESRPLHDPCVMLLAEAPGLFGVEPMGLRVDLEGEPGALLPDPARPPVKVAMTVDGPGALALLAARLTA